MMLMPRQFWHSWKQYWGYPSTSLTSAVPVTGTPIRVDWAIPPMLKATKDSVNYGRGMVKAHCGPLSPSDEQSCQYFESQGKNDSMGRCAKVYGHINPKGWCKLWKRTSQ